MHKKYTSAFEHLERSKEALLQQLSSYTPAELSSSQNGKWSPLQHTYHLFLAEEVSLKYVIKKLSFNPQLKKAGISHQLKIWALNFIEITPFKFKAPAVISEQAFPENLTLEMVRTRWAYERINLKDFLTNLDQNLHDKEIYKQPSVGRLTIKGMLHFFQFHHDRHKKHIDRELVQVGL